MIPDRRLGRENTRKATLVIRSLTEFRPELFGLPPFIEVKLPRQSSNELANTKRYEKFYISKEAKPMILAAQRTEGHDVKDDINNLNLENYVRNLKSNSVRDPRRSVNIDSVKDVVARTERNNRHYRQRESLQPPLPRDRSGEFKP